MKPSTLKGRLAAARYAHDVTMDQYNRLPVPSLEELCAALRDNRWLCALVETARLQRDWSNDGGVCATPETFHDKYATGLAYDALVAVVPFLRRLGYSVMLFSDRSREHPFNVGYPGRTLPRPSMLDQDLFDHVERGEPYGVYLLGTAPEQVRRRGLLKCVPRLLGWLRAARIALADPRRPGAMEALTQDRDAALAATDPPHWKTEAVVQAKRKRSLVDALHADDDDVADGARWFNIQERGKRAQCREMRIEAVAGDHFVFQYNDAVDNDSSHKVVVLHRDAFDVDPWPEHLLATGSELCFVNRFREELPASYEEGSGSEDGY